MTDYIELVFRSRIMELLATLEDRSQTKIITWRDAYQSLARAFGLRKTESRMILIGLKKQKTVGFRGTKGIYLTGGRT